MSVDNKDFFERTLTDLRNSQSNFDLMLCKPESIAKPNDTAYLTKNTEGIRSRAQDSTLEDFQARSRLNREPRQPIVLIGDSIVRTFAEVPDPKITSVDAIIAQLEAFRRKVCSSLELKLSEYLADSLRGSHLENTYLGYLKYPVFNKEKIHVHQGVLEFSASFNYAEFGTKPKEAPTIKQVPKLLVGDEVTWEFYVEGYREKSVSIVVKSLGANMLMLRDGFIVDSLEVYRQSPYIKVGKIVMVRRVDVVNGGHKIIYSND